MRFGQVLFSMAVGVALFARAQLANQNFEAGLGAWTVTGAWGVTAADAWSPTRSATDSPGAFYANNTDTTLALAAPLDLSASVRPALRFYHRFALEDGFDWAHVEASTDGGASWAPLADYTGMQSAWTRVQLDLADYAGAASFRFRFRLVTDASVVMDGWFVDDVLLGDAPDPPELTNVVAQGFSSVALAWSPSESADVARYRLYRGRTADFVFDEAVLIGTTEPGTTTFLDIAAAPKTRFYYRVAAVSSDDLESASNEASVLLPAGMDFPFLDNGEAGGGYWTPNGAWALSDEAAFSGTHAWSDSPGGNYTNAVNTSIVLSAPLDLRGTLNPTLCFVHRHAFAAGDSGNAEVSSNGGVDWTTVRTYTGSSSQMWRRERFLLAAYTNSANVLVRFRVTTDTATTADGWIVDDISVAESPATINAPVASDVGSHTLRLTWGASSDPLFSHYAVFRSSASGVGINSTLVTNIHDAATATCLDTGLALDSDYYYRVYAVNGYGTYSADGTERYVHTANHPVPYADDFEAGAQGWNVTGQWAVSPGAGLDGGACLTDSPGTTYTHNQTTCAQTSVNLSGTAWPVLRFRDRYALGAGDYVRVEASPDGANWTRLYGVAGQGGRTNWLKQEIDLSQWKNQGNVRLRFTLATDNNAITTADGWFVDDVSVVDHAPAAIPYPFYEGFEDAGWTNRWLAASWLALTNNPQAGASALSDRFTTATRMAPDTQHWLTLAGELDLTGAVSPQIVFWVRGTLPNYSQLRMFVSRDGGLSWPYEYVDARVNNGADIGWTRRQASLADHAGYKVRLRFMLESFYSEIPAGGLTLDGLVVKERPPASMLQVSTPHLKSVDFAWVASALGANFKRYELYRSADATVTIGDTPVFSTTNIDDLAFTDTGLTIGTTYHYGLFTVDTDDVYSAVSQVAATTVPQPAGFHDPMDTADNWDVTGAWGVDSTVFCEGAGSMADTPGANYPHNQTSYMTTSVNLSGTVWPVLRFRDRYALGAGDWIRVEVSPDGGNWTRLYGAAGQGGRTDWLEQELDLSQWKNQGNVRLRFTLAADNNVATTADGWFVDDVSVVDHAPAAVPYPFYEGFEDAGWANQWLASSWLALTNSPLAGAYAMADRLTTATRMSPDTAHYATLAGELDLTGAVNPQIVFWVSGTLPAYSQLRMFVSRDGGLSWPYEYADARVNNGADIGWTRRQASLAEHAGLKVRLRFMLESFYSEIPAGGLTLDGLVVKDRPPASMLQVSAPHLKSVDLTWTASTLGAGFKRYELYRSTDATITTGDTLIYSTTNLADLAFTDFGPDGGLNQGWLYYYGLYTVDADDLYSAVSTASAWTQVQSVGFTNPMEDMALLDRTAGSRWGAESNYAHGGSACIADSPGIDYPVSQGTTYLRFCVDLSTAAWPVLRFHDRYALGAGDWAAAEVSVNESSWSRVYGVYGAGARAAWRQQEIDLSPWKGQSNVRIRFGVGIDGNTTTVADGWAVDDLSVTDRGDARKPYPFYDGFEGGASEWISSLWTPALGTAYEGNAEVRNGGGVNLMSDMAYTAALGGAIDLTTAVNPTVTFWAKGTLNSYTQVRLQISLNGGVAWTELPTCNINTGTTLANWTKYQASLSQHVGKTIRLRLYTETYYGTAPVA
ncbi:MAG: hypothetical protein GX565_16110, partial [Lentisphaerae bacterium]|nr:hypothetical protein [Lentisphaerota bacterium]